MRDLNVLRISRDTETSSTLTRHRAQIEKYDAQHGCNVVGWVEDATVSGAVNLDERPSLGKWMRAPLVDTWDRMKFVNQARITRDDMHWWGFVGWLLTHDKSVIVLDDPGLDLTTPEGRGIAGIKAMQAATYRRQIVIDRNKQLAYYRENDLWGGGNWPFGYRAVRDKMHKGEKRYRLIVDPVTAPLVREAYTRLCLQSWTQGEIVRDWNKRGIMTAQDHQRHINATSGREKVKTEVRGTKWNTTSLRSALRRPTLMGYAIDDGEIRMRDGLPVRWADPILERHEFDLLQEVLDKRGSLNRGPRSGSDPLMGVLFCACGLKMYTHMTTRTRPDGSKIVHEYFVCSSSNRSRQHATPVCEWKASWRRTFLRTALEEDFLRELGEVEIIRKTFVPGQDRTNELRDLRTAVENLTHAIGQATSAMAVEALTGTLERHAATIAELEAEPVIPPRWEEAGTGETFGEVWERQDWEERGVLLRTSGIRLYVGGKPTAPDLHLYVPEDLQRRAEDVLGGTVDPSFVEKWDEQVREWRAEDREANRGQFFKP